MSLIYSPNNRTKIVVTGKGVKAYVDGKCVYEGKSAVDAIIAVNGGKISEEAA